MDTSTAPFDPRQLARAWHGALGVLELELNPHNFSTWLKGTRALRIDGSCLIVEARSSMTCEWLNQRMRVVVERAAAQSFEGSLSVLFVPPGQPSAVEPGTSASPVAAAASSVVGTVNCKFTFEGYLAGHGNEIALRSCLALVEPDALRVTPVVLYGSPGMGKTHLLHALACRAQSLGQRVACLGAEEFANRFLSALRGGRSEAFQEQIRSVDLLLIDDLQAIAGKKATLDELVYTMEAVTNRGGNIVIASEKTPFDLGLPERLESRLAAGIVTRVEPFAASEQRSFIEAIARRHRTALPAWAIDRMSVCRAPSVRVLLGWVNGAMALQASGRLDLASLDARLAGTVAIESNEASRQRTLLENVAKLFEIAVEDLCGRARNARLNDARAVAVAALQHHGASLGELSLVFGKRDKSTIVGLRDRGKALIESDPAIQAALAS
ncbi:MAG: DnaA/Hda family protein [bacterium]